MKRSSILQDKRVCYICGTEQGLETHHVFFGSANRKLSDQDGCVVYLCRNHHTGGAGVHFNKKIDNTIKERCQRAWMETYELTEADFIRRYGRSYL